MDASTIAYYSINSRSVANRYEGVVNSLSQHFQESFVEGSKILDIGCGSGRDMALLHKLGYSVFGVDATPEFVNLSQELHPELEGRVALACLPDMQAPFGGEFDGVLCSAVLMHIDVHKLSATALSIKHCLNVKGRLLYSVPSKREDVADNNRDANGRLFIPNQSDRLKSLFESIGFKTLAQWGNSDSLGRDEVAWESVLMELAS